MQLYVADYLGDTRHLTTEQHGAYLLLLMAMWRADGVLPDDPAKLARITGLTAAKWRRISDDVLAFFTPCEGGITQQRLAAELAIANEKSQKRSQSGKAGARAKALKTNKLASANASRLLKHSPEPEPELKKEKATPSQKKGSRLAPDWRPSEADLAFATGQNMTIEEIRREADQFRDYWIARPGAGGVKLDWPATWRTWCRNRRTGASPSPANGKHAATNGRGPADMAEIARRRREERSQVQLPGDGWLSTGVDGIHVLGPDTGSPSDGERTHPFRDDAPFG